MKKIFYIAFFLLIVCAIKVFAIETFQFFATNNKDLEKNWNFLINFRFVKNSNTKKMESALMRFSAKLIMRVNLNGRLLTAIFPKVFTKNSQMFKRKEHWKDMITD